MWLRAHCFCSFNSPCLLRSHIKQQQQPDFLHTVSRSLSLSFILHGMVSSFADSGVCLQGPQLTARLELMAHAQKRYSHCRSRITHNGGKQADASVSAIQNQRILKGNVGGASPPVVSIPISSVLCLLNCVHMWVCRGAAGCSSSVLHITMTGGTKEPRDFCLHVDLTNDASLMEPLTLK